MSSLPADPDSRHFSYRDYAAWPEGQRYELIRGRVWAMSPAPTWNHQKIALYVAVALQGFLEGKSCQTFMAPVDVFLYEPGQTVDNLNEVDTVIQPDVGVVCDKHKILPDKGVFGAPDLVVEVLSPSSVLHDLNIKRALYEAHGVREYWVVDTRAEYIMVFALQADGHFGEPRTQAYAGMVDSGVLSGFSLDLTALRASLA